MFQTGSSLSIQHPTPHKLLSADKTKPSLTNRLKSAAYRGGLSSLDKCLFVRLPLKGGWIIYPHTHYTPLPAHTALLPHFSDIKMKRQIKKK